MKRRTLTTIGIGVVVLLFGLIIPAMGQGYKFGPAEKDFTG